MRYAWRKLFVSCLAALWAMLSLAAPGDAFFSSSFGDYRAELELARQQNKQGILIVVEAAGCPFCHRMRSEILARDDVKRYFHRHFNVFTLDWNGSLTVIGPDGIERTEKELARHLKVRGTPTFIFFAPDGREMARHAGATRDAETFLALGRYVVDGHWQTRSFEEMLKSR